MDKNTKQIREALKAELSPHIVGLRNEIKKLIKAFRNAHREDQAEIKQVHITNHDPAVKKVEVQNPVDNVETLKHIEMAIDEGSEKTEREFMNFGSYLKSLGLGFSKWMTWAKEDAEKTKSVEVENLDEIKFPKEMEITNFPTQKEPPKEIFIKNRDVGEAIPVVLTSADRKKFYSAMTALFGSGGGGVPTIVIDLLKKIDQNTDQLELKADTVILNTDELEARLGDLTDTEATGNGSINAILKRIRTLLAKIPFLTFIGDRLKVDADVTVMPDPRPGLRIAEFLKESGGSSDLNVDGSVTPVTFSAAPPTGKKWFIQSVTLVLEDASINFTKFGGIPGGLTNGIEIRVKEGGLAEATLGTFKTNGDFHVFTTDIRIDSAATDFLTVNANIKENTGTTLEIADANSEIFKIIVNDDLTTLDRFNVLIKGFEVAE